jgi:hypothetical protein
MNKKEAVEKFIKIHKQKELLIDKLQELFGFTDSVMLYDTLFAMEDFSIELVEEIVDDKEKWIEWFVYENDCGEKELEAGRQDNLKKIKTVDDLLELIEMNKKMEQDYVIPKSLDGLIKDYLFEGAKLFRVETYPGEHALFVEHRHGDVTIASWVEGREDVSYLNISEDARNNLANDLAIKEL